MSTAKKAKPSADAKAKKPAATKAKAAKAAKPAKEPKPAKEKAAKPPKAAKAKAAKPHPDAAPRRDGPAPTPPKNGKSLLIVESPAKARTIKKYLGRGYTVKASVGHILDLPKSKMGVDTEHGFEPEYVIIRGKGKVIEEIRDSAANVETVYLAPDPDREGEAIAWHLASQLRDVNRNVKRVLINEITKKGVTAAISAPTDLDQHKYDAQQARRVLDRLVGYQISPILWKKVMRGLSAGRVQSVATRLVVEREREIGAFRPEEYWTVDALCDGPVPPTFGAKLHKWKGEKAELQTGAQADEIVRELKAGAAVVEKVERKERKKNPAAPFITSRLQQEAARKLRFTAKKTMALAQRLYEGVDLGEDGPVGLITYMRTDSVRLSDDAVTEARAFIADRYGADFLPEAPVVYKSAKQAQGAHEAIRPTTMKYDPDTLRKLLVEPLAARKRAGEVSEATEHDLPDYEDYLKLYTLIWNRFIACQMAPAVYDQTSVDIARGQAMLRASGQVMKFAGFTRVYTESEGDDDKNADADDKLLPALAEGDAITLKEINPEQHFTQPPPRFTEASLVKELEDKGIGRPSTYANILSTIQDRGYVEKREGRFFPTELGTLVNDLLVDAFPDILNADFTASMEESLDKVEEGGEDWVKVLKRFYEPFKTDLASAEANMRDVKREEIPTEHICEKCGNPMVIKWGRNGSFLACKNYPECKNTKEFKKREDGTVEIQEAPTTDEKCETCGADMLHKRGRFGEFLACSRYPECKTTKPISVGVNCPKEGCGGYLTEKRSRKGRVFYGCSNYSKTKCDFVVWDRPIPTPCPNCNAPFLVKRVLRRGTSIKCVTKDCGYMQSEGEATEDAA